MSSYQICNQFTLNLTTAISAVSGAYLTYTAIQPRTQKNRFRFLWSP